MKLKIVKITKNWSIIFDQFGYAFAGHLVLIPTIGIHFMKGYYQVTFSFLKKSFDVTLFNSNRKLFK